MRMENYINLKKLCSPIKLKRCTKMLKTMKVSEAFGMPVYTDEGDYYGDVEESIIAGNKIYGWRVRATKHSRLARVLSGAKGATVPHNLVRAVGDIMIISKNALPEEEQAPAGEEF
jgi:sporulation protein YlmC with PRC-barrel domain